MANAEGSEKVRRKVRGKNTTVFSACVVLEIKSFAISVSLGAWVWNLKTDKKKERHESKDWTQLKEKLTEHVCKRV